MASIPASPFLVSLSAVVSFSVSSGFGGDGPVFFCSLLISEISFSVAKKEEAPGDCVIVTLFN